MAEFLVKDIDYDFEIHPITGDLLTKTDINAINQNLKTIILANLYEKPFRTDVPVAINQFLFENDNGSLINFMIERIYKKITQFEPRATNVFINVSKIDNNGIVLDITYKFNNKSNESFTLNIERNR